jgi:succinoglycan biosynthesis transport protein ExoP
MPMNDLTPYPDHSAVTSIPPAVLSERPNVLTLLKALRRRWASALSLGLVVGCCTAVAMWFLQPPRFMARTTLNIPPEPRLFQVQSEPPRESGNHQRTHEAFAKSRTVLRKTLDLPQVAELSTIQTQKEPINWLEKHLQASFADSPEILRIQLTGDHPDELVVLLKALRDTYEKEFREKEELDRQEQLKATQDLLTVYTKRLNIQKDVQKELAKQGRGMALDARARALTLDYENRSLTWAERTLQTTDGDLREAQLQLETLSDQEDKLGPKDISDAAVQEALQKDPLVGPHYSTLLTTLGLLQSEIEVEKKFWKNADSNPRIKERQAKLMELIKEVETIRIKERPRIVKQLLQNLRDEAHREITKQQTKIATLQRKREVLEADVKRLRASVLDLTNKDIKIDDVNSSMGYLVKLVAGLKNEEEALKILIELPTKIKLLEEAYTVPAAGPSRLMATAIAGLAGFLAVCFMISWKEFHARKIETIDEVIQGLGLRIVGAIPTLPRRWFRTRPKNGDYSQHIFVESIETTRTMLLEAVRAESMAQGEETPARIQVVMITSAQAGEGKTSVSSHLAVSLAQIGHKTLLVDADMRNPSAHRIVGLEREPGCSELLRGEVDLTDAIRATPITGLWLISGGKWNHQATRALAQPRTAALLQELRQNFDFIVIDTPPVLPVADPLMIAKHADVVVFSVLCNVSRMRNVYTACQRLSAVGVRAVRTVISGVRGQDYDSSYQYLPKASAEA